MLGLKCRHRHVSWNSIEHCSKCLKNPLENVDYNTFVFKAEEYCNMLKDGNNTVNFIKEPFGIVARILDLYIMHNYEAMCDYDTLNEFQNSGIMSF